jgi:hypothetical protein
MLQRPAGLISDTHDGTTSVNPPESEETLVLGDGALQCATIALMALASNTSCSLAKKAATNTMVGC